VQQPVQANWQKNDKKKNKKESFVFRVSVVFYCMHSTHPHHHYLLPLPITTTITTTMQWPSLYLIAHSPVILFYSKNRKNKTKSYLFVVAPVSEFCLFICLSPFLCLSGYTAAIWNVGVNHVGYSGLCSSRLTECGKQCGAWSLTFCFSVH